VAVCDFAKAQSKALAQTEDGSTISYRQVPESFIKFLQLPGTTIVELVAVDADAEFVPGGTSIEDSLALSAATNNHKEKAPRSLRK
jgi:hypothetical protein